MKVAILAERYPVDDGAGGIGVRFWEMAQVLSTSHQVRVLVPRPSEFSHPNVELLCAEAASWQGLLDWCDVALFGDMPDPEKLLMAYRLGRLIVCDNAVPIEQLHYPELRTAANREHVYRQLVAAFELQVLVSDIFLTRSAVERATLLSAMAIAGRLNHDTLAGDATLGPLIFDVPIGFNTDSAAKARDAQPRLDMVDYTWNGGIWDYFNAPAVIEALSSEDKPPTVRFMYPCGDGNWVTGGRDLKREAGARGLLNAIDFRDESIPHRHRDGYLLSTRALLSIAHPGIENETCIRLRLRDAFLCNLPVIVDAYGMTGQYVRACGIGLAVASADERELRQAMRALVADADLYETCRRNLADQARSVLLDDTMAPLLARLSAGAHAVDRNRRDLRERIEQWPLLSHEV